MPSKKEVIDEREALLEMYKAGFLDGYSVNGRVKTKKEFVDMNKFYKLAFLKRFEKKITKHLKTNKDVRRLKKNVRRK
jgi:hypothetical protein